MHNIESRPHSLFLLALFYIRSLAEFLPHLQH